MVLMHGFGCDQGMWDMLEPYLEGRLIRYDLTGMGGSDYAAYDRQRHSQLAGHAADLIAILEALGEPPVDLVGHSVSALIAGLVGAQRPDLVDRVVMICPNPCYLDDPPYKGGFQKEDIDGLLAAIVDNYQGWAGMLAGIVAGPHEQAAARLSDRFCRNDPAITQHFAEVTFKSDLRAAVPSMARPTLVLDVADDAVAPAAVGDFMMDHLPNATRVTLDTHGHAPHMTDPEPTAAAIRKFLT